MWTGQTTTEKYYLVFLVLKRGTIDWGSSGVVNTITRPSGKNLMYLCKKKQNTKKTPHTHTQYKICPCFLAPKPVHCCEIKSEIPWAKKPAKQH